MRPKLTKKKINIQEPKIINRKLSSIINLLVFLFIIFISILLYSKYYDKKNKIEN